MKKIDINGWNRKAHFYQFLDFEDPFFNICADVDITRLKRYIQEKNESLFKTSYYIVLEVVNSLEAFRLRIRGHEVILHDKIRGGCPVLKDDRTFGFGYFNYCTDFATFRSHAADVIRAVKDGTAPFDPQFDRDDLFLSSVIPWISFKSFEHAKRLGHGDSLPKIVMGKPYSLSNRELMPISVAVHHSLMDGIDVGDFFEAMQDCLDRPEKVLR